MFIPFLRGERIRALIAAFCFPILDNRTALLSRIAALDPARALCCIGFDEDKLIELLRSAPYQFHVISLPTDLDFHRWNRCYEDLRHMQLYFAVQDHGPTTLIVWTRQFEAIRQSQYDCTANTVLSTRDLIAETIAELPRKFVRMVYTFDRANSHRLYAKNVGGGRSDGHRLAAAIDSGVLECGASSEFVLVDQHAFV